MDDGRSPSEGAIASFFIELNGQTPLMISKQNFP